MYVHTFTCVDVCMRVVWILCSSAGQCRTAPFPTASTCDENPSPGLSRTPSKHVHPHGVDRGRARTHRRTALQSHCHCGQGRACWVRDSQPLKVFRDDQESLRQPREHRVCNTSHSHHCCLNSTTIIPSRPRFLIYFAGVMTCVCT